MTIKRARVLPSYKGNNFEVNKNYKVISAIENDDDTVTVFLEDENGNVGYIDHIHLQPLVEINCEVCGEEYWGEEPEGCCDGRECGCMGRPINGPFVCSEECYEKGKTNKRDRHYIDSKKLTEVGMEKNTYIFHREDDGLYPLELSNDDEAVANAELNKGTVRVDRVLQNGEYEVVWEKKGGLLKRASWDSFRESGLLLFVNTFLQIFGWTIVVEYGEENVIKDAYPVKTKYRGFNEQSFTEAYKKVTNYMANNMDDIKEAIEG